MPIFPPTTKRVSFHTDACVNERIECKMLKRVRKYETADAGAIYTRLQKLNREWDTERVLEANAAAIMLAGSALGLFKGRKWFFLSGAAGLFLLGHALWGWCPPLSVIRRLGIRTEDEIRDERELLERYLGD